MVNYINLSIKVIIIIKMIKMGENNKKGVNMIFNQLKE